MVARRAQLAQRRMRRSRPRVPSDQSLEFVIGQRLSPPRPGSRLSRIRYRRKGRDVGHGVGPTPEGMHEPLSERRAHRRPRTCSDQGRRCRDAARLGQGGEQRGKPGRAWHVRMFAGIALGDHGLSTATGSSARWPRAVGRQVERRTVAPPTTTFGSTAGGSLGQPRRSGLFAGERGPGKYVVRACSFREPRAQEPRVRPT